MSGKTESYFLFITADVEHHINVNDKEDCDDKGFAIGEGLGLVH